MAVVFRNFYKIWSQGTNLQTGTLYIHHIHCQEKVRKKQFFKNCTDVEHLDLQQIAMWTSRSTHSYVSFTVHFITDEYHLKHHLLETKEFTEAHTAENIVEEMTSIISEWGLESADLIAATTDNASNIKAALHILQCLLIFIAQPMPLMYLKENKQTCIMCSIIYYIMWSQGGTHHTT